MRHTPTNQTTPSGDIVKTVSQAWTSIGSGSGPVNSPCSGNLWPANTYGPGLGFAGSLYLAAGEVSNIGHFWALDLATRTLHEVTDLGTGRWENAVPIDTGPTIQKTKTCHPIPVALLGGLLTGERNTNGITEDALRRPGWVHGSEN